MAGLLSGVLPYLYSQGDRAKRHVGGLLSDPMGTMQQAGGGLLDAHRDQQKRMVRAFGDKSAPFRVTDEAAMMEAAQAMLNGPLGMAPAGMTAKVASPYWHDPTKPPKLDQFGSVRDASSRGSAQWAGTDTPEAQAQSLAQEMRQILSEDWRNKDFDPSSVRQGLTGWAQEKNLNLGLVYRSFLRELNATKDLPDAAKQRVIKAWSDAANS